MTTYGTIPIESINNNHINISRAKQRIYSSIGTRRPWLVMFQFNCFAIPSSFLLCVDKIRKNALFFRTNYLFIILFLFFLSSLWRPFSLIVLTVITAAWWFLYFLREDPLVVLGVVIHDKVVMLLMLMATFVVLMVTKVRDNIMAALFVGVLMILAHGALRNTDDLVFDDGEEEAIGHLPPFHGVKSNNTGGVTHQEVPLRNAASSSFSS